jgi:hypothetical protein
VVQVPARTEEDGASLEVDLAEMLALVGVEGVNLGVGDDPTVAPAEDELLAAERTEREHAAPLGAGAPDLDVLDHPLSANAVSQAAS